VEFVTKQLLPLPTAKTISWRTFN